MKEIFRKYWPFLLLISLAVFFLGDVWFGGRMLFLRDFFCGEGLNLIYFGQTVRGGGSLFWNSLSQCGVPYAAQPYYGVFYPPNWIFVFPQVEWVIRVWWTFHLALAAISTYALARHWRLSRGPALFAGISFAFSTTFFAWQEFTPGFCSMTWMPLIFLFTSRLIDAAAQHADRADPLPATAWSALRGNALPVIALGVVCALNALASAEFAYYSAVAVGSFAVVKLVWLRRWKTVGLSVWLLSVSAVVALGLAMPQLILTVELMSHSVRTGEMASLAGMDSAHPYHWLSLLLPYLFGRPGYPDLYWAPKIFEFAFGAFYVGILPLIAVFFCFLKRKGREAGEHALLVWFFVATAVAGLLMAAGDFTPVYAFLHHWLPGLGRLRFPTKALLLVVLSLALLGGFGFQALLDNAGERSRVLRRIWVALLVFFGVFGCGFLACLMNARFLPWLMACSEAPTAIQIGSALHDYALAVLFAAMGLVIFGLLAFLRGPTKWIEAAIVVFAFANLCVISRQAQPTVPGGVYTRRPEMLEKELGHDWRYRFFSSYFNIQQYIYGETRIDIIDWLQNAGGSNHMILDGLPSVTPCGMVLGRYNEVFQLIQVAPPMAQEKIFDLFALKTLCVGQELENVLWMGASRNLDLVERDNCLPRAFVVGRWSVVPDEKQVLRTIFSDDFSPRSEASIEPLAGQTIPESPAETPFSFQPVDRFEDRGASVSLEVTAKQRGLLVLSDTWYPGWAAKVDGVPTPIFRANYLFRGVFLEPGTHRVEFSYTPTRFTLAVWIWLVTVAGCGGLVWLSRQTRPSMAVASDAVRTARR